MPSIETALAALDGALSRTTGGLHALLNPPLDSADFSRLAVQLLPYNLPDDVRALYLWHDGAQEPFVVDPPYSFLSFKEALALYRLQFDLCGGAEGWNPLWFPLFDFQNDLYCTLLSLDRQSTAPIYLSSNQDTEIYLMYSDLGTLISSSAACYESASYFLSDHYIEEVEEDAKAIRLRHGCSYPNGLEDGVTSFSKFNTQKWPSAWRKAIGRSDDDYLIKGASATVTRFMAHPHSCRMHVKVVGLMGTSDESVLEIEDKSGAMTVLCPNTAIGYRELQIRRRYEMSVDSGARPSHFEDVQCDATVTRLVRLD